ncbi:energy-coupling factor transporter transmembrane protein EcfT [Acidianus sulfidivorans JP7]|uniref:energy-coupling factor transporter transmembrane component T family protein n=1 Tax=Acidianus sulfidivorans TaxID=312539 RepID=UPI00144303FC|nr:energy-coupling factor transporter transmembrane protein EcfT [Acidianus sulfidivorans]AWR97924.2 energy-coupling factor transporter transmembrane protein EcfT [Acidianus sulfidivorans JP7]
MVFWSFLYEQPIIQNVLSWILFFYGVVFPILLLLSVLGLRGFLEITRYESGKTFLYKLNPLTKIVFGIVVMIVASTTIWWIGAILTIVMMALYFTLTSGKRKFAYITILNIITIIGGTWGIAPYTPNSVLQMVFPNPSSYTTVWVWPSYFTVMGYEPQLTLQALIYGLQISFRITAVLDSALLLILTTTTSDIFRMFSKIKVPLAVTFSILVGLRTVPKIFELFDTSIKMQFVRGLGYNKPKIINAFYFLYAGILAIIPTMVYLLRGAKNLAISADTRGFRAYNSRTSLVELTIGKGDYIMFGVAIGLIVLDVLANLFGFGRSIPYVGF